nr:hypothetical protein [Gordonia insulae]
MCRSAAVCSGLVVAAVLAGCGGPQESTSADPSSSTPTTTSVNVYEQQRAAGVQATLDDLGKALRGGDRARMNELVDAAASPQFRQRLQTSMANLSPHEMPDERPARSPSSTARPDGSTSGAAPSTPPTSSERIPPRGTALELDDFGYRLTPTEEAETPVPTQLQARLDAQGSSDTWVAPVELHYALGGAATPGIDEPDVVVPGQLVMARYGDAWKVVGDATVVGGTPAPTQLWDLPGLAADDVSTAGGTSVIASYPDTAAVVARARRLLPGSIAAVTEFWGADWPRRAVVVATDTPAEFRGLAQSSATDITGAAAATVYSRVDTDDRTAIGQRVILTPSAGELPEPALGVVLRHELTHVAARVVTAPGAPLWITEGVPEYVGRKGTYTRFEDAAPDLAMQIRAGELPTGLPADGDFAVDADRSMVAYQSAWSVAAYVADRYGEDDLKKLYTGVAGTDDPRRQDAAIKDALGVPRAELVAGWRRWLTDQVR